MCLWCCFYALLIKNTFGAFSLSSLILIFVVGKNIPVIFNTNLDQIHKDESLVIKLNYPGNSSEWFSNKDIFPSFLLNKISLTVADIVYCVYGDTSR